MKGRGEFLKKLKFSSRKDTRVLLEGILTNLGLTTCWVFRAESCILFSSACFSNGTWPRTLPCGPLDCWLSHAFVRDQNCRLPHLFWNPNKNWQTKNSQEVTTFFIALLQFFTYLKCWLIFFFFFIIDLGGICWLEFGDAQGTVWYFLWKCIWDECCSSPGHYCAAVSRWQSLWVHWSWSSVMFP